MGSMGPPFLEMLIIFPPPVSNVREREEPLHKGIRCPQQPFIFCEIFYVWGIDFMGLFMCRNLPSGEGAKRPLCWAKGVSSIEGKRVESPPTFI